MAGGNVVARVQALCAPIVEQHGCELVEVTFRKEGPDMMLTMYVDKRGGVKIEDCERISRAIDPVLDEADPIEQSYCLVVSSPGLDRPLKTKKDFERHAGELVEGKLYAARNGIKTFAGTLLAGDEKNIRIRDAKGNELQFDIKDVANVRLQLNFEGLGRENDEQ